MADEKHDPKTQAARELAEENAEHEPKEGSKIPGPAPAVPRSTVMGSQSQPAARANMGATPPGPAPAPQVENREAPHGFGQSGAAPPLDTRQGDQGSRGRYRLLAPHMIGGYHLQAGTEVGEGTGYPVDEPSNQMEGVDETAKGRVNELHQKLYGKDAPWHDPKHPIAQAKRDAENAAAQRDEEAAQPPVSNQQAWERGDEEFQGQKLSGPPGGALVARSISGDTSQPMGPGTPRQDKADEAVQVRPERPLQDSMPQEGAAGGGTQQPHKR